MELFWYKPDPSDAKAVWSVPVGHKLGFAPHNLVLLAVLTILVALTATLGSISLSSDVTAIVTFWPAAALQIVFSIWFGIYGAIAGVVGPMFGNSLVSGSPFLFVPANALQSSLAGLWFRYKRLDPRLRHRRDWAGVIIVGCLASNLLGAVLGVSESYLRGFPGADGSPELGFWAQKLFNWFLGNAIPCLFLAPALLKSTSSMVVRGPFFCQRFLGGARVALGKVSKHRFRNLPVMAKLGLLTLLSGILPLSVVAAWTIWFDVHLADRLIAQANQQIVREIRSDIGKHELLLRLWVLELEKAGPGEAERLEMLRGWSELPETFTNLEILSRANIESEMEARTLRAFRQYGTAFYDITDPNVPQQRQLRGAVRLASNEQVLTGLVEWIGVNPLATELAAGGFLVVMGSDGSELYRNTDERLCGWQPGREASEQLYKIRHNGQNWHVAESELPRLGMRFVRLMPTEAAVLAVLTKIPNPLAVLINLAIFGSLIGGNVVARQISERVLAIADHVQRTGGEPGKIAIPIRGRDELGYLGETLNRMSRDLRDYVRRLQETTVEKERLAAEMELARQVQMSILPKEPPKVPGYEFAAFCNPAREVGGDFYDIFLDKAGRVVMMIGDAVGKGLKAAMFITQTHGFARAVTLDKPAPDFILKAVNSAIVSTHRPASEFVTMFCGVLEPQWQRLLYASAGHNPPILLRDGRTKNLEIGGTPLALSEDTDYQLHEVELSVGDIVIMYTDGMTEAFNGDREQFGTERLEAIVGQHSMASAEELVDGIVKAVCEFASEVPQSDDMTLLVVRRCE